MALDGLTVGNHVLVKLDSGKIVFGIIKAIINKDGGVKLQVDLGLETVLILPDQVAEVL